MKFSLKAHYYYIKEIAAFLFLILAVYFFRQQEPEIVQSVKVLKGVRSLYIILGIGVTVAYIVLNGLMYVYSFRAVNSRLAFGDAIRLFLKRNLISIFLPGGGITSLAFFTRDIESRGVSKTRIGFASYIYAVISIASLVLVALPVLAYLALIRTTTGSVWIVLAVLISLIVLLLIATWSFFQKKWLYRQMVCISPQFELLAEEMNDGSFSSKKIMLVLLCSVGVEIAGILHLFIAMKALGFDAGFESCIAGYIIATLFYAISPFLRGLGAVEVSLVYVLISYGFTNVQAISITVLYRLFEFWLPLLAGAIGFLFVRGNILLRLVPANLLALLGIVNIISVLTPPLADRIKLLRDFLPLSIVHFSNLAVLVVGILLLVCAAFLIRGFRNAWRMAIFLSVLSLMGHLAKAIDYEEASLALFTIIVLLFTQKQYRIKGDARLQNFGIQTALLILFAVIVYGVIGFYFIDKKEFGIDFSLVESVKSTVGYFFLLDPNPEPLTHFAKGFAHSINLLGILSTGLLAYTFISPLIFKPETDGEEKKKALKLLEQFGRSGDDYFKTYFDKSFFFSDAVTGFIAYKIASGFAIVMGEPVCKNEPETFRAMIASFEQFCSNNGVKPVYYKIDESRINLFNEMGKKALPMGQEAMVDLIVFSLEGKDRKSLRNALNAVEKKGFKSVVHLPPIKEEVLQKLQYVSDDWLHSLERKEIVFSQGIFNSDELKNQTIITLENAEEKIVAFLNIIPDYAPSEGTYDLVRKTEDAPPGSMDVLIIALANHFKNEGLHFLNMGMAPMSGIEHPKDLPAWTIKFAYDRLRQFRHYHGLRDFKDKFDPAWETKYLIYENHYDLLGIPAAISKVIKP